MQLGPQYDFAARLSALEDALRRLQAAQLGQAFSVTQSDGSVGMEIVQNTYGSGSTGLYFFQGPNSSRDPSTGYHGLLMYAGEVFVGGAPDDSAVIIERPTGTESMVAGNAGVQILDPAGHRVVGTDEYGASPSNQGLSDPMIPLGQPITSSPTNNGWPNTTSASMASVAQLTFPSQHPRLTWYGFAYCGAGTFGNVQVTVNNGAAGLVWPVGPGGSGYTSLNETFSLGTWSWQQALTLSVNAELTSGAGPVYVAVFGVWGCGSLS